MCSWAQGRCPLLYVVFLQEPVTPGMRGVGGGLNILWRHWLADQKLVAIYNRETTRPGASLFRKLSDTLCLQPRWPLLSYPLSRILGKAWGRELCMPACVAGTSSLVVLLKIRRAQEEQ